MSILKDFKQSMAGFSALQVETLESRKVWISSTVIEPKSKKTLSEIIRPGSNALPGGAACAGCWAGGTTTKPTATMVAEAKSANSFLST
jgi:hypothetical protein